MDNTQTVYRRPTLGMQQTENEVETCERLEGCNSVQEGPSGFYTQALHVLSGRPLYVFRWVVMAMVFVWVGFTVSWFAAHHGTSAELGSSPSPGALDRSTIGQQVLSVDVHGDVMRPGVYQLPLDARVVDAIRVAGGYVHPGDSDNVNEAEHLIDGEEVTVPGPVTANDALRSGQALDTTGPHVSFQSVLGPENTVGGLHQVDLNTANLATLETLPGIGPAHAEAILKYRLLHGPFSSIQDLTHVHGFGVATIKRIAPDLFISRPPQTGHH